MNNSNYSNSKNKVLKKKLKQVREISMEEKEIIIIMIIDKENRDLMRRSLYQK